MFVLFLFSECSTISMGQGQEVHARRLVSRYMQGGGWALLQNCHLGLGFMDELLETVTDTHHHQGHENFRVWITTEVCIPRRCRVKQLY